MFCAIVSQKLVRSTTTDRLPICDDENLTLFSDHVNFGASAPHDAPEPGTDAQFDQKDSYTKLLLGS